MTKEKIGVPQEVVDAIREMTDAAADEELRQSLSQHGWVPQFPAYQDEHGTILVGNRRMRLAKEKGIKPVIEKLMIGDGEAADAERFKLAFVSNIGGVSLTPADRKRIAIYLRSERKWSQERVAEALGVSQPWVSKYAEALLPSNNAKEQGSDTLGRKKSSGRPKKSRAEAAPQAVEREERVAVLMDLGKSSHEIADDIGLGLRAANQAMEHVRIRREAEAIIDPATLSLTAQEKLAAAMKQMSRKLEITFEKRVQEEASKRLEEMGLPHWKKQVEEARRIQDRRKGIMDKATFNRVRRALHPDSRNAISDKVLGDAFDAFMALEKFLLNEKDSPTELGYVPGTLAEWDALKQKGNAERRAKKTGVGNGALRLKL